MTYAIFSIVANEVSPSGCSAYTYAQYSYDPYLRGPFHQLSEQLLDDFTANGGTHPAFPFLTGHGGANQVVLYGYLGLRLLPDRIIHIDPNLPPQIPQVRYRTFYWRGWPISAASNYTHTTISRATSIAPLSTADQQYRNQSISVQVGPGTNGTLYQLPVNGSVVTVPNRQIGSVNTVAGNIAQCRPVQSWDNYQPGQYPISVVDGAASTKWEPEFAANLSSVTVSIPQADDASPMITGFYFDWAQAPPVNASVVFHNMSVDNPTINFPFISGPNGQDSFVTPINVTLSGPYDATANSADQIILQGGNTTNYTFAQPVPVPKYATLFIQGNQALDQTDLQFGNGTGATVAEWAILAGHSTSSTPRKLRMRSSPSMMGLHARRIDDLN
jgi:hypothetical protein